MRDTFLKNLLFNCLLLACVQPTQAADPQDYHVDIGRTGDGDIDATLRATSELESLRSAAPVSPFGVISRARGDVDRFKTVLESYGYYESIVTMKIDGLTLSDPNLGERLNAVPKGQEVKVAASFQLGPVYHLRRIDIDGELPLAVRGALGLAVGAPAVAADVLAAGSRLLTALQQQGYAFAKVDPPVAYQSKNTPELDVVFHVFAGERAKIGDIRFIGLKRVHERLLRKRLQLRSGNQYNPDDIERARRDLLGLGVFAVVSVQLGPKVDGSGGVPVTFDLRERPRHAATINSAYSSDLGGSGGITWTDRDVFGNAEQLTVSASLINLGGSATKGLGYDTGAKLSIPDAGQRDQSLQFSIGATKQFLQAYDQTAVNAGVTLNRKLSSIWSASVGISSAHETVVQEGAKRDYTLIAFPLSLSLDTTHLSSPLDDPTHGVRASLSFAPTHSFGPPDATFLISQVRFAGYFDFHELAWAAPGRSVLAARAMAGLAQGAGEFSLPPDQRFYGGGSGTIRGYRYQAVGPLFEPDGNPIGGTAIIAGSVEMRQRLGTNYGVAVFIDGGQVSASLKPLPNVFRIGVGVGIRYYTPIGPIRLDVAVPTERTQDNDKFELYIGLGQAF